MLCHLDFDDISKNKLLILGLIWIKTNSIILGSNKSLYPTFFHDNSDTLIEIKGFENYLLGRNACNPPPHAFMTGRHSFSVMKHDVQAGTSSDVALKLIGDAT